MKWLFVTASILLALLAACGDSAGDHDGAADAAAPSLDATADLDASTSEASSAIDGSHADRAVDGASPCNSNGDDSGGGPPDALECTGLYSDWPTRTIAPDVAYYDPGFKL